MIRYLGKSLDLAFFLSFSYILTTIGFFLAKKTNIFFSIDPEGQYYGNALAILTGNQIGYIAYPGTPYQFILAIFISPVRLFFLFNTKAFIDWSILSIDKIFFVFRFFNSVLYFIGIYLIFKSLFLLTRNGNVVILAFLGITSLSMFPNWILRFSAEGLLVTLFGLWLFLAVSFSLKKISGKKRWWLPFLAGLGTATKITFLAIPLATVIFFLLLYDRKKVFFSLICYMKEVSQFIILGFLIGVFPILNRWRAFIDWIKKIVLSAGSHGGETFLLEKYFSYLYFLFQKDLLLYFFLIFVPFILFSLNKIWKKKRTIKLLISLFFSSFFCIFLFAKYHDSHYQIVNYLIISVLSSLVIVVIPSAFKKIVFLILIFLFSGVIISNFQEMVNSFDQANRTRDFIKRYNDNSQLTIWTYFSPSREYALIHGYIYSGFYGQELRKIYPNIINIDGYPKKVYDFDGKIYELKDFCWKNAFIPSFMLEEFLEQYQQYGVLDDLEIFSSPDKNLYFIQRAKCTDSEKRI